MLAIIRGNDDGWGSAKIIALFVGAIVLLAAFVASQLLEKSPMFDLSLFRKPTFTGASIVAFTLSAGMFAMFLYLTLYLQTLLGLSPAADRAQISAVHDRSRSSCPPPRGTSTTRVPVRFLLGTGLGLAGLGLLLMHGLTPDVSVDRAAAGNDRRGSRRWTRQPGAGGDLDRGGPAAARRDGRSGSTTRSARSGRPPGSRCWARCSKASSPACWPPPGRHRRSGQGDAGRACGRQAVQVGGAERVPAAHRAQAHAAIHVAFTSAMNEILLVGGVVALAGAALAAVLVRDRDFVKYGAAEAGRGGRRIGRRDGDRGSVSRPASPRRSANTAPCGVACDRDPAGTADVDRLIDQRRAAELSHPRQRDVPHPRRRSRRANVGVCRARRARSSPPLVCLVGALDHPVRDRALVQVARRSSRTAHRRTARRSRRLGRR